MTRWFVKYEYMLEGSDITYESGTIYEQLGKLFNYEQFMTYITVVCGRIFKTIQFFHEIAPMEVTVE